MATLVVAATVPPPPVRQSCSPTHWSAHHTAPHCTHCTTAAHTRGQTVMDVHQLLKISICFMLLTFVTFTARRYYGEELQYSKASLRLGSAIKRIKYRIRLLIPVICHSAPGFVLHCICRAGQTVRCWRCSGCSRSARLGQQPRSGQHAQPAGGFYQYQY